jgi:acyl carrier protein phosphodiesterase
VNFLAHFHLAWPDPGLVVGALEGDYRKGPLGGQLAADIEDGVRLHRAVDAFTDDHPEIRRLRAQFPPDLRRYAGILIDLSFDHYLTRYWPRYSELELAAFNREVYRLLRLRRHQLAEGSRRMAARLEEHDLLNRYHHWETVTGSAERIGNRLRRGNPLLGVQAPLAPLRPALEDAFLRFYPQLAAFSQDYRARLNPGGGAASNVAPEPKSH